MEIYKIKSLDCKKRRDYFRLLVAIMSELNLQSVPTEGELERRCRVVSKKYNVVIGRISLSRDGSINLVIRIGNKGQYSIMGCSSYYEALCKYILYVVEIIKTV